MGDFNRPGISISLLLFLAMLVGLPGFAQTTDLSGEWSNRSHEDQAERGGGPPLGDYLGIPLNDEGRIRADSPIEGLSVTGDRCGWGRVAVTAPGLGSTTTR